MTSPGHERAGAVSGGLATLLAMAVLGTLVFLAGCQAEVRIISRCSPGPSPVVLAELP